MARPASVQADGLTGFVDQLSVPIARAWWAKTSPGLLPEPSRHRPDDRRHATHSAHAVRGRIYRIDTERTITARTGHVVSLASRMGC